MADTPQPLEDLKMNSAQGISLLPYNTFHIDVKADQVAEVKDVEQLLKEAGSVKDPLNDLLVLGGGSNVLLTGTVHKKVLLNRIKGIVVVQENEQEVFVKFNSGELWHDAVMYCVQKGWAGIENLSLIPGSIGAAPIQNIGAYGVELKDVFEELSAINMETMHTEIFNKQQCEFGYRDSIFKHSHKGRYFILSVTLKLNKQADFKTSYGDLRTVLDEQFGGLITVQSVSEAVCTIRRSKLPDPDVVGNAGSFFKNPVVAKEFADKLKELYPEMPVYPDEAGIKIPAGWLIERCGWKGYREGNFGVHEKQALVLVNFGGAGGADIYGLARRIITSVQRQFNIALMPEVNIW